MCGIAGFNWEDKELLLSMNNVLSHRGPDQSGTYEDRNVSLGHRRLSIIDLSEKGRQPMGNEDGTSWIVFNGEIYNFKEIKAKLASHRFSSASDTEVIIHAYEEHGTNCVQMLNGDFAFAIYDSRKKLLFLARDRLGIKPLYYYANGEKFVFASELKAVLEDREIEREINHQALWDYLSLRFVPGENTIIKGVKKLLPGHYAVYDLNAHSLKVSKYWDISPAISKMSEKEAAKRFAELFKDSVEKRLISDVPLGYTSAEG
jgi:asparagine synthase (glutamine-hydrolysing)